MYNKTTGYARFSKFLAVLCSAVLLFCSLPMTGANAAGEISVTGYTVDKSAIASGESAHFTVSLSVDASVDTSSIKLVTSGDSAYDGTLTMDAGGASASGTLTYNGIGTALSIDCTYKLKGQSEEQSVTLWRSVSESQQEQSNKPQDNDERKPILSLSGTMPKFDASQSGNVMNLTLSNISTYTADNVVISTNIPTDTGLAFDTGNINQTLNVGRITSGKNISISIPVSVREDAKAGFVEFPITITYYNVWSQKFEITQNVTVEVNNPSSVDDKTYPVISVSGIEYSTQTPGPDGKVTATVTLQNTGTGVADKVTAEIKLPDTLLIQGESTKIINGLAPKQSAKVTFDLYAPQSTTAGNHQITYDINAIYKKDQTAHSSYTSLYSIIREGSATVDIRNAGLDKNRPGDNNVVNLNFQITNPSSKDVKDVTVSLDGLSAEAFTLYKNFDPIKIANLKAGETKSLTFSLYVAKSLSAGNYPLKVKATYTDDLGAKQEYVKDIFLYIDRPEGSDPSTGEKSTPRVIINRYSLDTDSVMAGVPFEFNFTLFNTSSVSVKNMKVTVMSPITDGTAGVFLPVEGTNSFFIDSIPAGGSHDVSIRLSAKTDSETKSYPIEVMMEYEDGDAKPYSVKDSIALPVVQPQRLEVGTVNYFPFALNVASSINFNYVNKGRSPLYNLTIRFEGPFRLESGDDSYYVGNFTASSSDYFDDMLVPTEAGEVEGKVIFEYEDVNGNKNATEVPFSVSVPEEMPNEDPGIMDPGIMEPMPPEESGPNWWLIGGIGAGVLLRAVIVFIVIRKRKKKKEWMLDE